MPTENGKTGIQMWMNQTLILGSIMTFAAASPLNGQAVSPSASNPPYFLSVAPQKKQFLINEKRIALLNIVSTDDDPTTLPDREVTLGCSLYRVHIEKDGAGEPEKTEYYRHILGDFRKGDGPGQTGGSCVGVPLGAGATVKKTYDLSAYYDLTKPGHYFLYIEFYDQDIRSKAGSWIRSNTATFDVQADK